MISRPGNIETDHMQVILINIVFDQVILILPDHGDIV